MADRLGAPGFVPLAIDDGAAVVTPASTTAVAGAPHGAVRGLVEIDLPNGCRVRVEQDILDGCPAADHRGPGSAMIGIPPGVRILIAMQPVDFRKGMDGLAALVQQALRADPFAGEVFIFRPRRADRVKILVYDGNRPGRVLAIVPLQSRFWIGVSVRWPVRWSS